MSPDLSLNASISVKTRVEEINARALVPPTKQYGTDQAGRKVSPNPPVQEGIAKAGQVSTRILMFDLNLSPAEGKKSNPKVIRHQPGEVTKTVVPDASTLEKTASLSRSSSSKTEKASSSAPAAESSSDKPIETKVPTTIKIERASVALRQAWGAKKLVKTETKGGLTQNVQIRSLLNGQIHKLALAFKSVSTKNENYERVMSQIQEEAKKTLADVARELPPGGEKVFKKEMQILEVFAGALKDSPLTEKESALKDKLLQEMTQNKGRVGLDLMMEIRATPLSSLLDIWNDYAKDYLLSPTSLPVPFGSMGIAFKNNNKGFEADYASIKSDSFLIKTTHAVEDEYRSSPKHLDTQLTEIKGKIRDGKKNISDVVEKVEVLLDSDLRSRRPLSKILVKARALLKNGKTIEENKPELQQL